MIVSRISGTALLGALIQLVLSVGTLRAGGPFAVTVDRPSRIVHATGYTTFSVYIRNVSGKDLQLRVVRVVNDRPDTAWHISICSPEHCYGEEVDSLEVQNLPPGGVGGASVHVMAGVSDSANVVLRLEAGADGYSEDLELRVAVGEPPQPPISVNPGALISYGDPNDSVEFFVVVTNTTSAPLNARARRIESNFPSDGMWRSRLCTLTDCFPDSVGITPEMEIAPGGATAFKLRIFTGDVPLSQGQVEVAFDPGDSGDPIYLRFLVTVASSSGVPGRFEEDPPDAPYPLPTDRSVVIPLADDLTERDVSVSLYDVNGRPATVTVLSSPRTLADGRSAIELDVAGLPVGVYFYRLASRGHARCGWIVVAR